MTTSARTLALILVLAFVAVVTAAPRRTRAPIFGDIPLDRYFRGKVVELKGNRVKLQYDFEDPEQARDFYYHRPFPREGTGRFEIIDGRLLGVGGGGFVLEAVFEPDIVVTCEMELGSPARDVGMFLQDHKSALRVTLFVIKETFFLSRDGQDTGVNMIVELGSEGNPLTGVIEFRYVTRSYAPPVAEGVPVTVRMERDDEENTLGIGKSSLSGADYGTPLGVLEVGFFVNGGRAVYDDVIIEATLDQDWLEQKRIALFLEKDLENPANRLKSPDKKALKLLRGFEQGEAATGDVVESIANRKLVVFLREKLTEAVLAAGRAPETLELLEPLLRSDDLSTRSFASLLLAEAAEIDFGFGPEAPDEDRLAAVGRLHDYVANRSERLPKGHVFLGGAWRTPEEVEAMRLQWDYARVVTTDHFVLTTNVTKERAAGTARLLEAAYGACGGFLGKEPNAENLPLRVHLFASNRTFKTWCEENGQDRFKEYNRVVLGEERLGLTSWEFRGNEGILNVAAQLYHRATFESVMPLWYQQAFATYFSWMGAYSWTGGKLRVGKPLSGGDRATLKAAAGTPAWISIPKLIELRSQDLTNAVVRKLYYIETWALLAFLTQSDEYNARWTEFVARARAAGLTDEDNRTEGARIFREAFEGRIERLEKTWIAWIRAL